MDAKEAIGDLSKRERRQLQGRQESPAFGASGEETVDAKDAEDDKKANVGCSRRGRKQLQGRQEPPGARASRSRSLQEQEPP